MKWLFRIVLVFVFLTAALSIVSHFVRKRWGEDVDSLKVEQGAYSFTADRNDVGVWKIKTKNLNSLSFAFGYVQAQDREFQTELLRWVSTGHLAGYLGETFLPSDRLMRFSARIAEMEWKDLEKNDPERAAFVKAYADGRNYKMAQAKSPTPVEYKVFNIDPATIKAWEPWEILALSRYQAWTLSYDYRDDILRKSIDDRFPKELAAALTPAEPANSASMYGEPSLKSLNKSLLNSSIHRNIGNFWMPEDLKTAGNNMSATSLVAKNIQSIKVINPDMSFLEPLSGGSNSWFIGAKDSKAPSYLCNDPHLSDYWPSALYPVQYEVSENGTELRAKGFSFPGAPLILMGELHKESTSGAKNPETLAFAITAANYIDQQDLIRIEDSDIKAGASRKESYHIRNPVDDSSRDESFTEVWTKLGPKVDDILDFRGGKKPDFPIAMDWVGFRKSSSPFWFFYQRNKSLVDGIKNDLVTGWDYPNVNFTYFTSKNGSDTINHVMTGVAYARKSVELRVSQRQVLSKAQALSREFSFAGQRPHVEMSMKEAQGKFFENSNQRIFSDDLARKLAFQSVNDTRSAEIMAHEEDARIDPSYSQTDHVSGHLKLFLKWASAHIDVAAMCSGQMGDLVETCQKTLKDVSKWDGNAVADSWQATFVTLWYQNFKAVHWNQLTDMPYMAKGFGKDPNSDLAKSVYQDDLWYLFSNWERNTMAVRFYRSVFESADRQAAIEKKFKIDFAAILERSAKDTVAELADHAGFHTDLWQLRDYQYLEWQHPISKIPGRLGQILAQGFFGPWPEAPGAVDSPSARALTWNHDNPLDFPVRHTAAMRLCMALKPEGAEPDLKWANSTGVSGNPFSTWAWTFARESYFKNKLLDAH